MGNVVASGVRIAVWTVHDKRGIVVATFPYPQRKRAEDMSREGKGRYVNLTKLPAEMARQMGR